MYACYKYLQYALYDQILHILKEYYIRSRGRFLRAGVELWQIVSLVYPNLLRVETQPIGSNASIFAVRRNSNGSICEWVEQCNEGIEAADIAGGRGLNNMAGAK